MTKRNLLVLGGISIFGVAAAYAVKKIMEWEDLARNAPTEADYEFREGFARPAVLAKDESMKIRFEDHAVSETAESF